MSDTRVQVRNLEILIRSRYPVIYIVSPEEKRVVDALNWIASQRLKKKIYHWSRLSGLVAEGLEEAGEGRLERAADGGRDNATLEPEAALSEALNQPEPALFVFKDFHHYLDTPAVVRALREAAQEFAAASKTLILTGPWLLLPPDLEKDVTVIDFPMPGLEELGSVLDNLARSVASDPKLKVELAGDAREDLIKAAHGLTLTEAENVFTRALVVSGCLGAGQIPEIIGEKRQIVRKSGLLDYFEPEISMDEVGGLDNLKRWLAKRKLAFSERAREFGLPAPRGVLILGVQGCGKSMCAKAVSSLWNLPLLRLDIGRIFESSGGGSEANIRRAIALAEGIAPCILWMDEIDKAFGGQKGEGEGAGSAQRVLGTFLTWLSEKKSPVFVAATANNVSAMPPELLRKGRFDDIFFVDLPGDQERRKILSIHLLRRGRDPQAFDLDSLSQAMEGFSGAEIEQAVISALFDAFYDNGRELGSWDIMMAASETVPLSKTMREEIDSLRQWCSSRARSASESSRTLVKRHNQPSAGV